MLMSATGLSGSVVIAVEGAENRLFRVQANWLARTLNSMMQAVLDVSG
jgi:hypothetical protein